jgi:hypothetical protein
MGQNKGLILCIIMAIFLVSILSGCEKKKPIQNTWKQNAQSISHVKSINSVSLWFDTAISMQGFLDSVKLTNYSIAVDILQREVSTYASANKAKTEMGIIGKNLIKYTQTHKLIKDVLGNPKFYLAKSKDIQSRYKDLLKNKVKNGSMTVVFSDLSQNGGSISELVNVFDEYCIRKKYSIGIIGLRSQFNGTIYNSGINGNQSFKYTSNANDISSYRPFYIITIGNYNDVSRFLETITFNLLNGLDSQFKKIKYQSDLLNTIVISPYISDSIATFENPKTKLEYSNRMLTQTDEFLGDKEPFVKQLKARRGVEDIGFTLQSSFTGLARIMNYRKENLKPYIKINEIINGKISNSKINNEDLIKVDGKISNKSSSTENAILINCNLNAGNLKEKTVYSIDINYSPTTRDYIDPVWFEKWSSGSDENEGNKTIKARDFLQGLARRNIENNKPQIAHFVIYISKK